MFHAVLVLFAKRKPPPAPQRHKIVRRLGRRSGSLSGRHTAAPRDAKGTSADENRVSPPPLSGSALVQVSSEEVFARAPQGHEVSVSKPLSYRLATAVSTVVVPPVANVYLEGMKQTLTPALRRPPEGGRPGLGQNQYMEEYYTSRKGPLFATAVIAGTNAVKQASTLIPFCHPIPIQKCSFTFRRRVVGGGLNYSALPHRVVLRKRAVPPPPLQPSKQECSILYCFCTVATEEIKTGVEMEALTGATVAGLTLYDMLKGLPGAQEDGLAIGEAFILAKRGGRSDFTKLLMSEPDKLAHAAVSPPGSSATSPPPDTTAEPKEDRPDTDAAEEKGKDASKESKVEEKTDEEEDAVEEEEEEEQEHEARVERKPIASAPKRVASNNTGPLFSRTAGDTGAWWRSSKHEKKIQELYPRRKYGEGSRVSPSEKVVQKNHASEATKSNIKVKLGKPVSIVKPTARHETEIEGEEEEHAEDDNDSADVETEEVEETISTQRKHSKASQLGKKTGRTVVRSTLPSPPATSAARPLKPKKKSVPITASKGVLHRDKKTTWATPPPAPAADEDEEEDDEEGEEEEQDDDHEQGDAAEEEEEEEEEEVTMATFKKGPTRHKSRKARVMTTTPREEEEEDYVEEKPLAKGGLSKRLALRVVQHDSWDPKRTTYEEEVTDNDADEEPPLPLKKLKKRRR